ncbi:MAG: hypothetical protein RJA02_645, partial [Armatimonadota bacterium]
MASLSERDLLHARGLLHLHKGEKQLPSGMHLQNEPRSTGVDIAMTVLSLATVAASRATRNTGWIEQYRSEMQKALSAFDAALAIDAEYAPAHHGRAQALRYLGDQEQALGAARTAAALEPENADYRRLAATLLERSDANVGQVAAPADNRPQAPRPVAATPRPQTRRQQPNVPLIPLQPDGSPLTWDDIILPERTKRTLRQIQKVIESPEQARRLGVEPPSGLLLYGPPGTGKTTIAKILASQASCSFFAASPASKWIGEGEKAVSNLFTQARAAAPSIVFLDEIDALVPNRSGGVSQPSDKIVNQFLHEIDGLSGNQGVFVVGATNRPELLDDAVIRGGRLSLKIEIPAPDMVSRLSILALHTRGVVLSPDVDIEQLAAETDGYSGADLR